MFKRANANLTLTPAERAILKLLLAVLVAGGLAACVAVYPLLSGADPGKIDWSRIGQVALVSGVTGAVMALVKFFKAFRDPPLPPAAGA